jgi:cobalt-zinc-cadmium efflux system outer membrane protein
MRGRQLGLWLGRGQSRARADLTALPEVLTLAEARRRAGRGHPGLVAARARVRALRAELKAERLARVPGFALIAFATHELDRRSYGGSLAADLPVWNWGSSRIARARDLLAAGEKQLEVERRELEAVLIEAQASCSSAVGMARRYRDRVMPGSQTSASVADRSYQIGEATLLEVIDARRALLETRRLYLGALVQAQIECSRLRAVAEEEQP